jgi:formylglycine-generating enzyme required for sulfatase activity
MRKGLFLTASLLLILPFLWIERTVKSWNTSKDCSDCPEMVLVPPGTFLMGSPATEKGHTDSEEPQHSVTIANAFAVSKFELSFAEWDICVGQGQCRANVYAHRWGRGRQPVINVTLQDAHTYVTWLSQVTGKPYRLLSEAEYEYAARARMQTAYPWGQQVGQGNANCDGCGSRWDAEQPAPVGSFSPNQFGLYDMVGNVFQWIEDSYHLNYIGAPVDGSAWTGGIYAQIGKGSVRGGSWAYPPDLTRSASRSGMPTEDYIINNVGFRVAKTLAH